MLFGIPIDSLLQSTVRLSCPLILAAIGGIYSDKAGVSSIELEALVLMGAFAGFSGAYFSGSLAVGVLAAMLSGVLLTLIYGYLVIVLGCRSAVVGMALVMFSSGCTRFLNRIIFGISDNGLIKVEAFKPIAIPLLSKIPYLGTILFNQNLLGYIAFILVFATAFFYKKVPLGLEIKAVGENPAAADTVGIPVVKYRFISTLVSGALASLSGAYLSLASSNVFVEGMSSEKGYAAFSIIILGKYSPIGALLGCLMFGFADAFQLNLQAHGVNVPNQILQMLPYIFTLVVLFFSGKGNAPEGHNKFFVKGMSR